MTYGHRSPTILMGSVLNLPPEVFLEICKFAISRENAVSPLLLGKICRSWRRICYETPNLWSQPELRVRHDDAKSQLSVLGEWIERAKNMPWTVTVTGEAGVLSMVHAVPLFEYNSIFRGK